MRRLAPLLVVLTLAPPALARPAGVRVGGSVGLASFNWHTILPLALDVTYALGPVELGLETSASLLAGDAARTISACWGLVLLRAEQAGPGPRLFASAGVGQGVLLGSATNDTVLAGRGSIVGRLDAGVTLGSATEYMELAAGVLSIGNVAAGDVGGSAPDAAQGRLRVQLISVRVGAGVRF